MPTRGEHKTVQPRVVEYAEEWAFHNDHYGTREDVVFLILPFPRARRDPVRD
jgi:hypothetical protein